MDNSDGISKKFLPVCNNLYNHIFADLKPQINPGIRSPIMNFCLQVYRNSRQLISGRVKYVLPAVLSTCTFMLYIELGERQDCVGKS